jgi:hypothetical protein
MSDTSGQRPESLLPYERWTEEALRHVVVQALLHAAREGLPGDHHFYITFRTDHPGVVMPPRVRTQYPHEITIVLQHQFWELKVDEAAGLFSVGLSFGGIPANLVVPFGAVTAFADPHVGYGMRFEPQMAGSGAEPGAAPAAAPAAADAPDAAGPSTDGSAAAAEESAPETPQVVSLDAFRRRTPPKD